MVYSDVISYIHICVYIYTQLSISLDMYIYIYIYVSIYLLIYSLFFFIYLFILISIYHCYSMLWFSWDSQPSASGLKLDKGFELNSPSSMGQSYRKSLADSVRRMEPNDIVWSLAFGAWDQWSLKKSLSVSDIAEFLMVLEDRCLNMVFPEIQQNPRRLMWCRATFVACLPTHDDVLWMPISNLKKIYLLRI